MKSKSKEKMKKTPMNKRKVINTICIIFLSLVLLMSVAGFTIVNSLMRNANIEGIDGLNAKNSTQIYDENGEIFTTLAQLEGGVRENISYDQIPQVVIDAFLAVEDSRYFKHNGFDFPRFLMSGINNLKSGGIVQGGSTLTMQLVDVSLFSDESKMNAGTKEKIEQKIVEIFKSMEIESKIDKEKIIENYLNEINFGSQARGIQKGAQYYFGKDVEQITLSEAAFLAGVINAPYAYNPYGGEEVTSDGRTINHYDLAVRRRNDVLYQMHNHGYISNTEYKLALSAELKFQLNGAQNFETEKYRAYVDAVIQEVKDKTGKDPYLEPMKIYTSMNVEAQELADKLSDGEGVPYPDEDFQSGFVAMNNQTGEIVALGGGRGYTKNNKFHRATTEKKQPGSTAKPIVEYAQAFEYLGYSTEHVFEDMPFAYAENSVMYNFDRQFRGDVTFKKAVGSSLNVPAYTTLLEVVNKIGVDKELEILRDMGLDAEKFDEGMSIGGGSNLTVTPVEMAGAYSVFANQGNYIEPHTVKKVEFIDSDDDPYVAEYEEQKVFSEETAYLMSYMLKDAVDNTSYQTLVNTLKSSYPVYGKSGTTDFDRVEAEQVGYPDGIAKDKWMVGYTSQYTVSCWAGYDDHPVGKDHYLNEAKLWSNVEGTIVHKMLDHLQVGKEVAEIARPSGVVGIKHIQGLFPYATAENADGSLMVDALINKKFANGLKSVEPDKLASLSSFNGTLNGTELTINFSPYPDAEKLKLANKEKTKTVNGVSAKGLRIFDKSFLFGAVEYKYDIYVNGTLVKSGKSSSEKVSEQLTTSPGDKVRVVGYYGYGNHSAKSNEKEFTINSDGSEKEYKVPASFNHLFDSSSSFIDSSKIINEYMAKNAPYITYSIIKSSGVGAGKLDIAQSTFYGGISANSSTHYIIAIGED